MKQRYLPRWWQPVLLASVLTLVAGDAVSQSARELDERINRLEERLDGSALMNLLNDSSRLTDEVSALRGEIELIEREINEIKDQQRALYIDLDNRLQALETGEASIAIDPSTPAPAAPPDEEAEPADPAADYQAAFDALRRGDLIEARNGFEQFLANHPDDELTANARYWLGESYYADREFDAAIVHFQQVLDDHPDSNKHPDALLKIGFSYLEQGQQSAAEDVLEQLVAEYPESTAASLAAQRLRQF